MNHLSQSQLLRLWSELEQAYYGDNKYGGTTAEVYAYTLMEHSPLLARDGDGVEWRRREAVLEAAQSLYAVLMHFQAERTCRIFVNDTPVGEWLRTFLFDHRLHIRVEAQ